MSSTAGWFSGAAGQLAALRENPAAVDEPIDSPSRQHEHSSELHMIPAWLHTCGKHCTAALSNRELPLKALP